jgi:peptidoglycan biosynthesis protein MviN/MurJ (putative lipid II flippase)
VVLLYERGNFVRADSLAVANIIGWFCLQFPALLVGSIASIVLLATSLNKVFIPLSILVAFVNVAANFILMQWYGLVGIAISTAVTYVVSLVTMNIVLYRKKIVRLPQTLFIDLVASAGMAVILALVLTAIDGKPGPIPTGRQIALSTLGVGIYCLIAYLCARPTLAGIKGNTRNA